MMLTRFTRRRGDVVLSGLAGGHGELVVLLHGLAGSAGELAGLGEALVAGGYRVVALDQRGHGHSTRRPGDLSRRAYVDDVLALLDGPAWLVGQSMGAHTAMLVAAEQPVRGLVMISGGVGGSTDDYPKRLGEFFASWPVPFADEAAAAAFLGDRAITGAWIAGFERRADGLYPRFDADVMEAAIRPVAATARWAEWARVTAPTLLVHGSEDEQDPAEVRRMTAKPGVEQIVVAGAGHDVHLEQPDRTAQLVRDFIGG